MSLLRKLKQENHKIRHFSNQIKRYYSSNHHSLASSEYTSSRSLIPLLNHPRLDARNSSLFLCNVRFYAAPAQFLQPKEEEKEVGLRLNDEIKAQTIRLVSTEKKEHKIISRYEALRLAREAGLDLVEVNKDAKPPVCKIYDYKLSLFHQKEKEKEHKQQMRSKGFKATSCKEIRFAAKISGHDLQMKADTVKKLLHKGHRVKCTAVEPTETMDLKTLLSRFSALIEDVAIQESEPQVEKKQAFVLVRHVKFGGPRSGRKKAPKGSTSEPEGEQLTEAVGTSSETKDTSDYEDLTDEDIETEQPELVVSAPKQGMVNRYAKVQTDVNESTLNRPNTVPQMPRTPQFNPNMPPPPYQRNQPHFNPNASSQMRQPPPPYQQNQPHFNPNASSQMRQPPRGEVPSPQPPYQRGQPQPNTNVGPRVGAPPFGVQRQDPPPSGNPGSPTKTFGIFSPQPKDTQSNGQSAPAVTNRYQKANPPPGPERINRGPPGFNPNANPNRNEDQANFRRR